MAVPGVKFSMPTMNQWLVAASAALKAAGIDDPAREAHTILAAALNRDLSWIIAHGDEPAARQEHVHYMQHILERRIAREPLALVLGRREFYRRSFAIGPGVLVPRPETEHLVEWVLERHRRQPYQRGVDLCSGSGVIGISLALECMLPFLLLDISPAARHWSGQNIETFELQGRVSTEICDLLHHDLGAHGKFDLLTANPPYISQGEAGTLAPEITKYEPAEALFGGNGTGLEFTMDLLAKISTLAAENAELFTELGANQHKLLKSNHSYHGWRLLDWKCDLAGFPRIAYWKYTG